MPLSLTIFRLGRQLRSAWMPQIEITALLLDSAYAKRTFGPTLEPEAAYAPEKEHMPICDPPIYYCEYNTEKSVTHLRLWKSPEAPEIIVVIHRHTARDYLRRRLGAPQNGDTNARWIGNPSSLRNLLPAQTPCHAPSVGGGSHGCSAAAVHSGSASSRLSPCLITTTCCIDASIPILVGANEFLVTSSDCPRNPRSTHLMWAHKRGQLTRNV
ncbi:hypothetical protein Scep_026729 [Stephania cephalantha]|uniref:Uncharacterized protein n=1 Tax=Stephania cephalantha TaxID=152367 RepID=A0AAP0EKQ3_9MAGN